MQVLTDWENLTLEAGEERRNGKRVPLTFPIEISGFDRTARLFSERTKTIDISEAGCRFRLKKELAPGDVVALKLLSRRDDHDPPSKPLLFRVIWVRQGPDGWTVGALNLQQEKIWHVSFPPMHHPKPASI